MARQCYRWERYSYCGTCGSRRGTACVSTNVGINFGKPMKMPHRNREYTRPRPQFVESTENPNVSIQGYGYVAT